MPQKPRPDRKSERYGRFRDLMLWRIDKILLVCSSYDSFMLAEDRLLDEVVLREYLGVDLYNIPDLIRVSTIAKAVDVAQQGGFDLVICSPWVADGSANDLADRLRAAGLPIPVVLLAHHEAELELYRKRHDVSRLERLFLFQGDIDLLLAIVKYLEDKMNVAHDVEAMGVQVIILIEDNIRYYSSLLPLVYKELMTNTRSLVPEGVNLAHKLLRIKARPKLLLASNWEEAWEAFRRYEANVLGVISDVEFPLVGELCADAGVRFAREVQARQPDIPVVLQSGKPENEALAYEVGASFFLKGSPTLLGDLRTFMLSNFGFGDFVFLLPDGSEVGRASDLRSLEEALRAVPAESIVYHASRNHFSTWLKAHTEFAIAQRMRPQRLSDFEGAEDIRAYLIRSIREHRYERRRAVVTEFAPGRFETDRGFARIGGGSMGGKARGLAFANWLLSEFDLEERFPEVRITVPTSVVIATDVFDAFLDDNDLRALAITSNDDAEIRARFEAAAFPEAATNELREFLAVCRFPLAVRSSSLLEDAKFEPFAGIYDTLLIANTGAEIEIRLDHLLTAVKRVYASNFSQKAKRHLRATAYRLEEEKMAVIVQRLVGARHGERFYPEFAGVALSDNYYPVGPVRREDGIAAVALGLGCDVVEGGESLRFSPRHPEHLVQMSSVKNALQSSQRHFRALLLPTSDDGGGAQLLSYDLRTAEQDGTLFWTGSTYSHENAAIYDGIDRPGTRLVTFAGVLKHRAFPLADILQELLELGTRAVGGPVEIEFAVNMSVPRGEPREFGFLQIRPIPQLGEPGGFELEQIEPERVICRSSAVLGNGAEEGIHDVVMVDPETYDRSRSHEVAAEVARLCGTLTARHVPFLLAGVGRWGSADPYLGIPISWDQIAGVRVIVEAGFRDMRVEPSQGTHFFQNLIANRVGYFTVNPESGEGEMNWDWFRALPAASDNGTVRWIRLEEPLVVLMSGTRRKGVIAVAGTGTSGAAPQDAPVDPRTA